MPELGDAPIEEQHVILMNQIARGLDRAFNGTATGIDRKIGFVLLVFNMNEEPGIITDGRCNFISNGASRDDVVVLFREMIKRFEGQPEHKPGHA